MKFYFQGETYLIRWRYDNTESNEFPYKRNSTTCFIEKINGDERTIVGEATVSRYHKDTNDIEEARVRSLRKVLLKKFTNTNSRYFSREFSTLAWTAYHERKPLVITEKIKMYPQVYTAEMDAALPEMLRQPNLIGEKIYIPIQ